MSLDEIAAQRQMVVAEAKTWFGTPYHIGGRVKGVGCDCLSLLAGIFENVGLLPPIKLPDYAPDQNLHCDPVTGEDKETYLEGMLQWCDEMPGPPERIPLPGDLLLYRFGRIYFHGAMVLEWPMIIHSYSRLPVSPENAERNNALRFIGERRDEKGKPRPRKFFRIKPWAE